MVLPGHGRVSAIPAPFFGLLAALVPLDDETIQEEPSQDQQ